MMETKHAFCIFAAAVVAVMSFASESEELPDWENPNVNSVNRLPARSYSIPLADEKDALTDDLEPKTPYRKSLNGTWKIAWTGDPALRLKDFYRTDLDDADWLTVDVPSCLEMRGFGAPGYVNWEYPFAMEYPKIVEGRGWKDPDTTNCVPRILDRDTKKPNYNPVAQYRTTFTVPADWKGRQVILRFDGVYSAYYVWVNGKRVGYAEDSKLPSEFDITPYLNHPNTQSNNQTIQQSNNILAVEVYRWCDGSYLEDQDMMRFTGIFRDVTLWSRPKDGIWDFSVKTTPVDGYESWNLEVKVEGQGQRQTEISLYDADKKKAGDLTPLSTSASVLHLDSPRLWSPEDPYLYTLVIKSHNPTIQHSNNSSSDIRMRRVGFKEQKIVGNRFLFNGQPIKIKGVNRHETSAENGRTVSLEEMVADITLMKRYNVNAVRTSHYPNHRLWYDLCDRYGLYVIAEANVEGHESYVYWRDKGLGAFPAWDHSIVERNVRQVRFYRNHPSVVIWSMGNETGHGDCFRHAIAAVKQLDPSRPVHWECGNPDADIDSRMYPHVDWVEKRGRYGDGMLDVMPGRRAGDRLDQTKGKVFLMCEYAHAMGNAIGNLKEYWDVIYRYDSTLGGCIWDWIDQAVWKCTDRIDPKTGGRERHLAYGGDWDELPHDGPFDCNGIIGADRKVSPKLVEVGHVYRNLVVEKTKGEGHGRQWNEVSFELWNRHAFTFADRFNCRWDLVEDGVVVKSGAIALPHLKPLSRGPLPVDFGGYAFKPDREYAVNFNFSTKGGTRWAQLGWTVARDEILLKAITNRPVAVASSDASGVRVVESEKTVEVTAGPTRAVFCRRSGTLCELTMDGKTILRDPAPGVTAGPLLTCVRAFVDNDQWMRGNVKHENRKVGSFFSKGLTQLTHHARPIRVDGNRVEVTTELTGRKSAGFTHRQRWTFGADGAVTMENTAVPHGDFPQAIPRLGLSLKLDKDLEDMAWYGRGPDENYVDRCSGSFLGVWRSTVTDQYVDYARPQDCGSKTSVRWVDFTGPDGSGVRFSASEPMFVQALHYGWEDLDFARHRAGQTRFRSPLVARDEVLVNLDVRQLGLGGSSCGDPPLAQYRFDPNATVTWTLRMEPRFRRPATREETLEWFLENEYGVRPAAAEHPKVEFAPAAPDRVMKDGSVRKSVRVTAHGPYGDFSFTFVAFIPKSDKPVPATLLLCNRPGVMPIDADGDGVASSFWPREEIVRRGYAAVAFYLSDVASETYRPETALQSGVFKAYERYAERTGSSWGVLSAWAWGASRVMDWMEREPSIDAAHAMVVGHSRGGKCALVAGVTDSRFAMVCSNDSGTGGARLNRMDVPWSEPWTSFAHFGVGYWFCGNYLKAIAPNNGRNVEHDQDEWLSLVAPRLLAVGSAAADAWAGPAGERAAYEKAKAAWARAGCPENITYGIREGKHDLTDVDWKRYLDFADAHW